MSVVCFIPLHVFAVYSLIYVLIPRYLQQKKYNSFIVAAGVVALINFIAGKALSLLYFKWIGVTLPENVRELAPFRTSLYQGIVLALLFTGGIATGLKLAKNWYLQQMENMKIVRSKTRNEIKLLKAHMQPAFLFQSLNTLYEKIIFEDPDAPVMILKLADLLSHLLYDSDSDLISLEQELEISKLLISIVNLEKGRNGSVRILTFGDDFKKYISPLVLFSYLQTVVRKAAPPAGTGNMLDVVIEITDESLFCQLNGDVETRTKFRIYKSSGALLVSGNLVPSAYG